MLRHTFIHIPGVGHKTERELWAKGVCTWEDAAGLIPGSSSTSSNLIYKLQRYIPQTFHAVQERDASFFQRLARFGESWRLFSEFAEDCVYLDIETTGLSATYDDITVVGTSDGKNFKAFVKGANLPDLGAELKKYSVAVTFNGSGFDLPFLRRSFSRSIPQAHIDLRWVAYKLGYRGGLKEIERHLGIKRPRRIANMDGFEAVLLWQRYCQGDRGALERPIDYNRSDVMNLKGMMDHCFNRLVDHQAKLFPKEARGFANDIHRHSEFTQHPQSPFGWLRKLGINLGKR
jgi:uncharacterized protein YprB with RNaseH-like and TPR domain